MRINPKYFVFIRNVSIILIGSGILSGFLPIFESKAQKTDAEFNIHSDSNTELITVQNNSLLSISSPINPEPRVVREIKVVITAYSSTRWQTDDTPYITAAGTWVREGIVANNLLPFGTKIRIPELYGDKIFVVEDRMNSRKGYYHVDIWFPSYWEAKNFGAPRTHIEVLES